MHIIQLSQNKFAAPEDRLPNLAELRHILTLAMPGMADHWPDAAVSTRIDLDTGELRFSLTTAAPVTEAVALDLLVCNEANRGESFAASMDKAGKMDETAKSDDPLSFPDYWADDVSMIVVSVSLVYINDAPVWVVLVADGQHRALARVLNSGNSRSVQKAIHYLGAKALSMSGEHWDQSKVYGVDDSVADKATWSHSDLAQMIGGKEPTDEGDGWYSVSLDDYLDWLFSLGDKFGTHAYGRSGLKFSKTGSSYTIRANGNEIKPSVPDSWGPIMVVHAGASQRVQSKADQDQRKRSAAENMQSDQDTASKILDAELDFNEVSRWANMVYQRTRPHAVTNGITKRGSLKTKGLSPAKLPRFAQYYLDTIISVSALVNDPENDVSLPVGKSVLVPECLAGMELDSQSDALKQIRECHTTVTQTEGRNGKPGVMGSQINLRNIIVACIVAKLSGRSDEEITREAFAMMHGVRRNSEATVVCDSVYNAARNVIRDAKKTKSTPNADTLMSAIIGSWVKAEPVTPNYNDPKYRFPGIDADGLPEATMVQIMGGVPGRKRGRPAKNS